MKVNHLFIGLLLLTASGYSNTKIDFQGVANGTNVGFSSCGNNHVIESGSKFSALCDCINLNPQLLSYLPNFDSVQIIGIVYQQSTIGAWHSISNINNNGDTTWIEITYSIPSIPAGRIPQPGYKYQIVAIPKQSNPIAFKLVQSTHVNYESSPVYCNLSYDNDGIYHVCNLLGRQIQNSSIRKSFNFEIISKRTKTFKSKYTILGKR